MEVDIDPVSMLEQSMLVDDNAAALDDEDVVCLSDDVVATVDEAVLPAVQSGESEQPGGSLLMSQLMRGDDDPYRGDQDSFINFGEHFLINPNPSPPPPLYQSPVVINNLVNGIRVKAGLSTLNNDCSPTVARKPAPIRKRRSKPASSKKGGNKTTVCNGAVQIKKPAQVGTAAPAPDRSTGAQAAVPADETQQLKCLSDSEANTKLLDNVKRLSYISQEEEAFRIRAFVDVSQVKKSRLHCTVCGCHIGCTKNTRIIMVTHPLLKVLTCRPCRDRYCNSNWTLGPNNRDLRCRWCSLPHTEVQLKKCGWCPFAFCFKCLRKKFGRADSDRILKTRQWGCLACNTLPLYQERSVCWALGMFIARLNRGFKGVGRDEDVSECCSKGGSSRASLGETEDDETEDELVGVAPIVSRVERLFSTLAQIEATMRIRLSGVVRSSTLDLFTSDLDTSLVQMKYSVESCVDYIKNWKLLTKVRIKSEEERRMRESAGPSTMQCLTCKPLVSNGIIDYSRIFKMYNIRPCFVRLERLSESMLKRHGLELRGRDTVLLRLSSLAASSSAGAIRRRPAQERRNGEVETSAPPTFFQSLLPPASASVAAPRLSPDVILLDDDQDEDVICLD